MRNNDMKNKTDVDKSCLPNGWQYKALSEVCDIVSGGTPDRGCSEYWEGGTIPWATPTDITSNSQRVIRKTKEYITEKGLKNSSAKLVPQGSLLMTSRATIGEIKVNEVEMCTNQGFKTLVPNELVDNWFLFYQMKFLKQKYEALGSGSTFLEVSKRDTERFSIPMPIEIAEQKKIGDILITLDNVIEKTKQLIDKYKKVKQGLMQDLLSGKVRLYGDKIYQETKFKDSEIGILPYDKELCTINTYIKFQRSGLSRRITTEDIGMPVLTSGNIVNSKLNVDELKYWFADDPQGANIGDYVLDNEDILLCFINSMDQIGKVCIFYDIGRPCIYTTNLFRIKASEKCIPKFLFYLIDSLYVQQEIKKITKPAINQASFTKEDFFKILVPFYELEEQQEIIKILSSVDVKIEKELSYQEKLIQIKQGLMQDLLTGKVRVKVEGDRDE